MGIVVGCQLQSVEVSGDETGVCDEIEQRFIDASTHKEGIDGYSCENIG